MQETRTIKHKTYLFDEARGLYVDIVQDQQYFTAYLFKLKYSGMMRLCSVDRLSADYDMFRQSVAELLENEEVVKQYYLDYFPV